MSGDAQISRKFGVWSAKSFADSVSVSPPVRMIYMAGMGAEDADTGAIRHPGDIVGQARYSYEKLKNALAEQGATIADVVKITTYITDQSYRAVYGEVRREAFGEHPLSAHTFVVVPKLAWPDMLVEVDATAAVPL
jgi:enamine deaminase RidA (YjgF/YER057c/UK114 family)